VAERELQDVADHGIDFEQYHAILMVPDVHAAVEFYTSRLGFWRAFESGDPPNFAGVNLGRVQLFLENGTPSPQGCAVYFVVSDADKLHRFHTSRGVQIVQSLADREYHLRDYTVRDLFGYHLTFGHRI